MVQGYYTLEEAANILGMAEDKLSQMAQKREIRAFADRGTWRFRTQDVEEMSRRLGQGSDPELQMGDAPPKKRTSNVDARKPSSKVQPPPAGDDDIIAFKGDEDLIPLEDAPPPKKRTTGTKDKQAAPEEELFEFELSSSGDMDLDLDSEMGFTPPAPGEDEAALGMEPPDDAPVTAKFKTSMPVLRGNKTSVAGGQGSKLKRTIIPPEAHEDSGAKLVDDDGGSIVPLDDLTLKSDSDVKLEEPSDSSFSGSGSSELAMTEEMKIDDLDEELRRAEEASRSQGSSKLAEPGESPFELSESDLDDDLIPPPRKRTSGVKSAPPPDDDDDEVSLGDLSPPGGASGASGINLHLPADTGVNLEKSGAIGDDGGDEVEFELSLDAESTPAPTSQTGAADSSEFELTLDDAGGLAPLDESSDDSSSTDSADSGESSSEKDIFETDDNIPALDEESGSEAVALEDADTDLESSDFDFDATAQEEEDEPATDNSASQVVALDDDEEVSKASRDEEEDELEGVGEVEEEEEAAVAASAAPAPWGALPTIFLLPGVVVMLLLGLMTFELLHGMWGYKQAYKPTSLVLKPIAEMFGAEFPND